MNTLRRALALSLSALVCASPSSWACGSFGVRIEEAIQTGLLEGNRRTEMLAAKFDGRAPFIVKLFVGPRGAGANLKVVSAEEKRDKFDPIAARANMILNPPMQERGMIAGARGFSPAVVDEIKVGNITAQFLDVSGADWATLADKFQIRTGEEQHFNEWVKRVGESGRAMYAAYIDVRQVSDPAELGKVLTLAVTIPYGSKGADLRREVTLDKWLEYKGARGVASGFQTDWTMGQTLSACKVVMNDWDLADRGESLAADPEVAKTVDLTLRKSATDRGLVTFTLTGDTGTTFVYKNGSYTLSPHVVARPSRSAPPADRKRKPALPALGGDPWAATIGN